MPINFLALDYISIRKTDIHDKQSKLNEDKTTKLSKFKKTSNHLNGENLNFLTENKKKTNKNLIKIENPNIYESKNRLSKIVKYNRKNQNSEQSNNYVKSFAVTEKKSSYNFNENEFNEWLMIDSAQNQSLNSIEIEEFNKFISGTLFSEINKDSSLHYSQTSPSYSPLESICGECYPCSQIIELDNELKKRLETGIEKIDSMTIDSYIGSRDNLYISQNKIEIVVESDDESPWYDMNPLDIVDDYFENLKLKTLPNKNDEKLNQTPKQNQAIDESINEDYLYRFSECLELVKNLLDIIERKSDSKIEKKVDLLSTSTEKIKKNSLINDSRLNNSVPSSITITKLNKDSNLNNPQLHQCLSIQNNEFFFKMNYYRIENYFTKIIKICLVQLKLNLKKNEINLYLIKKIIEKNLNQNDDSLYLLLEFCLESLDLLFNCSWSSFLKYTKNFLDNYPYMPENKNSLNHILKEIEKTQVEIDHKFSGIESPKILILLKYIQNECEKIQKSKFLIIVPRRSIELDNSLVKSLCSIKTCLIEIKDFSEMTYIEILKSKHDCLIMDYNPLILNNLSQFTHLIIYEALKCTNLSIDKQIFESCQKLNIRYVEFEEYNIKLTCLANNEIEGATICSERVANNTFLVEFIEIELGIELITRNYEYIALENRINGSIICNADLLINEHVGIIFQDCFHFLNYFEEEMHLFLRKIFCFKYSLRNLIIILTNSGNEESNSNILIHKNVSRFLKFCKDSNQNNSNFLLSPIFVKNMENIKIVLRKMFKKFLQPKKFCNFTNEPTSDEKFLLSLGCFNSFNAQLILQNSNLTDLISMNLLEFKAKFNFLDDEKIDHFFKIIALHEN